MSTQQFKNADLTLEVRELGEVIEVAWLGKSTAREPGAFIGPILADVMRRGRAEGRAVSLDFRELAYMNSSTITPLIRLLHEARSGDARVTIVYAAASRWQELSFSALTIFQTDDKRIAIRGA